MAVYIDTLPWTLFKKLRDTHATKTILITPGDTARPGVLQAYASAEEYVVAQFRMEGFEVYRYKHNYESLEGPHPELGLVFMANASDIIPGVEVHGLIGHNIRPLSQGESLFSDGTETRD